MKERLESLQEHFQGGLGVSKVGVSFRGCHVPFQFVIRFFFSKSNLMEKYT